jgi:hypothetical protein|tara:strand:- start:85 stop:297 length:213 start_codon:yes stop_codon:yes gene_type:complete
MPEQQKLKFSIRQDGTVTEEVIGTVRSECISLTEQIEEKLGVLQTRQFKPEFYSNNVALQHNQNKIEEQT